MRRCWWLLLLAGLLLVPVAEASSVPLAPSLQQALVQVQQQLAAGQLAAAEARLRPLLTAKPHPLVAFSRAQLALLQQQPGEALRWLEVGLRDDPDHVAAWLNRAQAHYQLEQFAAAAEAFEQSFRLQPDAPRWRYNAALCYLQAGQPQQAVRLLTGLLEARSVPAPLEWHAALARALLELQRPAAAIEPLRLLAEQAPADEQRRWRELLLQQELALNRLQPAREHLRRWLRQDFSDARWWRLQGQLQLRQNDYRGALVSLQLAHWLEPGTGHERQLMADLCLQLGLPAEAARRYRQLAEAVEAGEAGAVDADAGFCWLQAGRAAWNARLWPQAEAALRRACRYPPQQAEAESLLAQLQPLLRAMP